MPAARSASAATVPVGLRPGVCGNAEAPATYRLSTSHSRHSGSTAEHPERLLRLRRGHLDQRAQPAGQRAPQVVLERLGSDGAVLQV
jgi:hypothetical protein